MVRHSQNLVVIPHIEGQNLERTATDHWGFMNGETSSGCGVVRSFPPTSCTVYAGQCLRLQNGGRAEMTKYHSLFMLALRLWVIFASAYTVPLHFPCPCPAARRCRPASRRERTAARCTGNSMSRQLRVCLRQPRRSPGRNSSCR